MNLLQKYFPHFESIWAETWTAHKKTQFNYENFDVGKFFSHLNFNFIYAEFGIRVELQVPGMQNHIQVVKQKSNNFALLDETGPSITEMYDLLDKRTHPIVKCFNMDVWLLGRPARAPM